MRKILVSEIDTQQTAEDFARECKGEYSPVLFPDFEHGYELKYHVYNHAGKLYAGIYAK